MQLPNSFKMVSQHGKLVFSLSVIMILLCIALVSLVHLDRVDTVPKYLAYIPGKRSESYTIAPSVNRNISRGKKEAGDVQARDKSNKQAQSASIKKSAETNATYLHQFGMTEMSSLASKGKTFHWYWISLREFWRKKITFPVRYDCKNGTVILDKATISPRTGIHGNGVIIFAGGLPDRDLWERLKRTRDPSQLWVFTTDESALTTMEYIPPREYGNKINFNLTFTYHSRSDISIPYGQFTLFENPHTQNKSRVPEIDYHSLRPKFVVWISSHCSTISWDRTRFVRDLSSYIPIDQFGYCGNLKCRKDDKSCKDIFKQYKFILAFENSCCPEYITEKFWNALSRTENVPVVIGGDKEDYERLGPPNSFVYAGDFESMQSLADYLKRVAEDSKLYNSFFRWKSVGYAHENRFFDRRIVYKGSMCHLLDYVRNVRDSTENSAGKGWDLYDSSWLGGCKGCTNRDWIRKYNNSPAGKFTFN